MRRALTHITMQWSSWLDGSLPKMGGIGKVRDRSRVDCDKGFTG